MGVRPSRESGRPIRFKKSIFLLLFLALLGISIATLAAVGGSISGTVKDASGAVVPRATITVTNTDTNVHQTTTSNDAGAYSFPTLPVGRYDLEITAAGFKPYRRTNIRVDVNSAFQVDAALELGEVREAVTVEESALQPETVSTQLGDVIASAVVASLPLNGRSYTDLLALQPGVAPISTITSQTVQGLGQAVFSPSGSLNPGTVSINGQRESANGYLVNGAVAEETGSMAAAIIPNLDSIAEFRILSDNFDAEYGEYSGGQINVITKSGTNNFHGDAFEFLRNTDLDAKNFFSPTRGEFIQNQFGGTLGGPILHNRIFFFTDYQGTRQVQGIDTGLVPVPSPADLTGNLLDQAGSLTGLVGGPCTVAGQCLADVLSAKLGYSVAPGEPYYFTPTEINPVTNQPYGFPCTSNTQCVFPNAVIPQSVWSAPAANLIKYIPACTICTPGDSTFSTSAFNETLRDDKLGERIDAETRWGTIFGYYSFDDYGFNNPYPTAQGGANVPGFSALYSGRAQLVDLGDTKTIGTSAVNEFHVTYTRDTNFLGKPNGGTGVSLASQGFTGIVPGGPQGVENVDFNGSLIIGTDPAQYDQINNDFGLSDGFSKVLGTHSIKFGAEIEYYQVDTHPLSFLNGAFIFTGSETGSAFADFLLGDAYQYTQNQLQAFYARDKYVGLYAQDSWRIRHNLTLNYGLRWDRVEPWYEKYNDAETFILGEQSQVFPTAPVGEVFPGDPGVPRTLGPPGNKDLAPRIGLAYSPTASRDSWLGKILGGSGATSIRASFGLFYVSIPEETLGLISDNAPYGFTYTSTYPVNFATPFVNADTGASVGQRFPAQVAPFGSSPSHPDPNIDFTQFEPISTIPGYQTNNKIPYAEEYMLSLQRQMGADTLLTLSYVGNQGHHLLELEPANPGSPALCLSLPGCGPNDENNVFTNGSGQTVNGTRGPLGPAFGNVSYQSAAGNSVYDALEASIQHTSGRMQFFFSYTYSKSVDDASNFGDEIDPFDPSLLRGLSSFDMRNNFVASYTYRIPFEHLLRAANRWTQGWSISGITRLSSGFPVTLQNPNDTSLIGTPGNGINYLTVDELDYTGTPLNLNHNPRGGSPFFNPQAFALPADNAAFGATIANTIGDSGRRSFSGPGINNFDLTLQKDLKLTESKSFEFRVEAFNAFNHAQFYGPTVVDGNINDSTFGYIVNAAAPRLLQLAAKFIF
jgi:hypothetical protein